MMNKSIGASIASLIAYGCMLESSNGAMLNQADAQGDYPEPYTGGLAQVNQADASGDYPEPYTGGLAQTQNGHRSLNSSTPVPVEFDNESSQTIELFWLNFAGQEVSYGQIPPHQTMFMNTYATHPWIARGVNNSAVRMNVQGNEVFVPEAADGGKIIHIDEADYYASLTWNQPVSLTFKNESSQAVQLFWHNYQGDEVSYGQIAAGATLPMHTFATHPWSAVGVSNSKVFMSVDAEGVFVPETGDAGRTIVIEEYESKTWNSGLINIIFDNESGQDVELFWHNYNGDEVSYGTIGNGQTRIQGTFATHPWSVTGVQNSNAHLVVDGDDVFVPTIQDNNQVIYIGEI